MKLIQKFIHPSEEKESKCAILQCGVTPSTLNEFEILRDKKGFKNNSAFLRQIVLKTLYEEKTEKEI